MSRVVSLLRFWERLFGSRAFRVLLAGAALLWVLDNFIWLATQRSFFASLGREALFWRQLWAPIELFVAFFALCLLLTRGSLRGLRPAAGEEAPHLRGFLARLTPLRARIFHISQALALVFALLLASDFARYGNEWNLLLHGRRTGFAYLGFDAALWTHFLPVWKPFLSGLWKFSLVLSFLAALTAILRALPALAAHNSAPPHLARFLWHTGAALLALRALLYLTQIVDLPRGAPLSSGDVLVLAPLWGAGTLWCAVLSGRFLRRSAQNSMPVPAQHKPSRAVFLGLAALFSPALLGVLSWPLRAILPETAALKFLRERATLAAWRLPANSGDSAGEGNGATLEQNWPVWDEASLLASRPDGFRSERVVGWQNATIDFQSGRWIALLAGEPVGATVWNSSRETSPSTSLAMERVDLGAPQKMGGEVQAEALPVRDAFYGLEGRSLFSTSGGISLASPFLKWAWAWRLRDLLLPVDASNNPHLLTLRGARERAQTLLPSVAVVGPPRLHLENENPYWTLDLCALSPHFPGAMRGLSSDFASANAVAEHLQMRLDARSGAVDFMAVGGEGNGLERTWRAANNGVLPEKSSANTTGGALLRAQVEVLAALRGRDTSFNGPLQTLNASGAPTQRVLSVAKNDFEWIENGAGSPILRRGEGDLGARWSALDAEVAKIGAAQTDLTYKSGEPFVWRDDRAPGGFWVARAYFAAPQARPNEQRAQGAVLWRVAIGGVAANARIGIGTSAREAFLVASGTLKPRALAAAPLNSKALSPASVDATPNPALPEVQALQNQRALNEALRRGDWKEFGVLSKRQDQLLESIVRRRQQEAKP